MTAKQMYFVMIGVLVLLVAGGGVSLFFGNQLLEQKSRHLVDLKLQNQVLDEQQAALTKAKKDIAKNAELDQIARSVVPQDKDQAAAVREIVQLADNTGIKLKSITFPASDLGTKAPAPAAGSGSSTPTAAPKTSPVSQAKPVTGIPGVYSLEMDISPDDSAPVTYQQFLNFLGQIETNRRTAQVSSIKIEPKDNLVTFTLAINIFIKP